MTTDAKNFIKDPILESDDMRKIYVGGIVSLTEDEDLKVFFEQIEDVIVTDHVIMGKGKKNCFAFVTFKSCQMVDEVLLRRKELVFNEHHLTVNRVNPKDASSHGKTKELFIANVPKKCTSEELKEYFDERHDPKYGTIESITLFKKKDEDGSSRRFGSIMVSSEDMADKMAMQHSTFDFDDRTIKLIKAASSTGGERKVGGKGILKLKGKGRYFGKKHIHKLGSSDTSSSSTHEAEGDSGGGQRYKPY